MEQPTCGKCGGVMTPKNARIHPEWFLHDTCLPDECAPIEKRPDCHHPASMYDTRLESGTRFCRVCELQDRCRDAETREIELSREVARLRPVFVAAQVFADSFAKFPNAALPGSPARQLFNAVKAAQKAT